MADPRPAAEIYDAFAAEYRAYSETKSAYIAAVDAEIAKRLAGKAARVLDFGAGDGVRGAAVARALGAERLVQADISDAMLEKCRDLGAADAVLDIKAPDWDATEERFDVVMCLWNVMGHVPDGAARRDTLTRLRHLIAPGGRLVFDVNNRHYVGYGRWQSLWRRGVDALFPDERRGDVVFDWKIDGVSYPASGHFFTAAEVRKLLAKSGYAPPEMRAVDYRSGAVSRHLPNGQMLVFAAPA